VADGEHAYDACILVPIYAVLLSFFPLSPFVARTVYSSKVQGERGRVRIRPYSTLLPMLLLRASGVVPQARAPVAARCKLQAAVGAAHQSGVRSRLAACYASAAPNAAPCALYDARTLSRRATVGGVLVSVLGLSGAALEACASEEAVAASDVAFSGEGWTLSAPSDYRREELSPYLPPPGSTVGAAPQALPGFGPAPPPNPVKLKLVTPGGNEVVSLAVRRAAEVRPQFLQVNDVADFGTLEEAASLFVPPRASLLASSATVHAEQTPSGDGEPLPRSYFTYEFALGRALCVLVAAAKRGKVRLGSHSVLTEIRV